MCKDIVSVQILIYQITGNFIPCFTRSIRFYYLKCCEKYKICLERVNNVVEMCGTVVCGKTLYYQS